eukprot:CAMPEP_0119102760 /NCGR_PEP_ID=MMETSP1180-20130426/1385_1 /TAXON_ID=3052 ORGANISM="Chlamydomonas cf sp, Strain CCMP681" /NCGR_SAMPLE_ID=MMETSP1180 /ASSEMBLY_ACC=CAM_ASM_000741 /LENGTH=99 /DNA_ID=CAMNT_0007087091 /DNA_START=322 /DNA_END=622 /DNA_ORIENTATION=-
MSAQARAGLAAAAENQIVADAAAAVKAVRVSFDQMEAPELEQILQAAEQLQQHLLIQAANEAAALAATRPQGQAAAPINQSSKDSMPSELHTDCRVMVA